MATLEVKDLHVEVTDDEQKKSREILKGVNLSMKTVKFMPLWDQMGLVSPLYHKLLWANRLITLLRVISC